MRAACTCGWLKTSPHPFPSPAGRGVLNPSPSGRRVGMRTVFSFLIGAFRKFINPSALQPARSPDRDLWGVAPGRGSGLGAGFTREANDVVREDADADLLADGVVVVARHERHHTAPATDA